MSSLNALEMRRLLAKGVVGQVADDQPVAIRLKAVNYTDVTSITVTAATDITVITGAGTTVYDFATYATIGELVDAINADGEFSAKVLDSLRSTLATNNVVGGVLSISSDGYYDVQALTSGTQALVYRLTYDRGTPTEKPIANHRVELKEIVYDITMGSGTGAVAVYQSTGNIETLLFQAVGVSGVATTINWAGGTGKISADDGSDLIIVVSDSVSVTGALTIAGYAI